MMIHNRVIAFPQFIVTRYFGKLFFCILSVAILGSFLACKKTSDIIPNTGPVFNNSPFEIKLVYPETNGSNPEIEINPNEVIKLIFRFTANESINLIDIRTKDYRNGEQSLEGYPFALANSNRERFPLNSIFQFNGYNYIFLTQQIRIPSYAKDSIIITVKAVKNDLSTRSFKLLLKVKKEVDFRIVNFSVNDEHYSGSPVQLFSGDGIYKISGSVHAPRTLVKVKAALLANNIETSARVISFQENGYDNYGNLNVEYNTSYIFRYYSSSSSNSFFQLKRDLSGKNFKLKITAFDVSGDSTSLEIPIDIAFKDLIQAGPFNLGGPRNRDYGQLLYSNSPSPTVSVDPQLEIYYNYSYSIMGYFQQRGENRLGSLAYLFPLRNSLGYEFPINYYNNSSRTYFRKVSDAFESVNAYYLDTMNINATDPEVISLQANDVIVFINNKQRAQVGVLKIHNIIPGDSGSVSLSCKYQKF